jgi:carbon-monoxide dehydrogenase medium subunit
MKSAPFDYVRAASVAEATRNLADGAGAAVAIAGGQSLMPLLALRVAPAERLVDLTDIPALEESHRISGGARIGAVITHAAIEDGKIEDPTGGIMKRVAAGIAYRSIRNHGTIGGSVALADPAADWPACLLALGATARIAGPSGERTEPMDDFLHGAYTTSLQPGEIITAFDVPALPAGTRWSYQKVVRKSGAFAMSIGCVVQPAGAGARVVLGGTTTRAMLMPRTARAIGADEQTLRAAIAADLDEVAADADDYQRRLHTATLMKAIREAADRS